MNPYKSNKILKNPDNECIQYCLNHNVYYQYCFQGFVYKLGILKMRGNNLMLLFCCFDYEKYNKIRIKRKISYKT